ncbi:MAG TPA: hypothetical protein VLX85_05650, partial [Stellaceae bacterium]|nr:hypothetical protein [Stellaceae bacterium]
MQVSNQLPAFEDRRRFWRLRSVLFLLLGLFLAWAVISRSLVAYLADAAPDVALWLRSDQATALLNVAERELDASAKAKAAGAGTPSNDRAGQPAHVPPDRQNLIHDFSAFESLARKNDDPAPSSANSAGDRSEARQI